MITSYLEFNILRVPLSTRYSNVRQLSSEISRVVHKLPQTVTDIKKGKRKIMEVVATCVDFSEVANQRGWGSLQLVGKLL